MKRMGEQLMQQQEAAKSALKVHRHPTPPPNTSTHPFPHPIPLSFPSSTSCWSTCFCRQIEGEEGGKRREKGRTSEKGKGGGERPQPHAHPPART